MALRKLELMYREFGKCENHTCRECSNLVEFEYHSRTYRKCKVYGMTDSEASDWAKRWLACGMFNKQWNGGNIMRLVRPERKAKTEADNTPIEGQLQMEV